MENPAAQIPATNFATPCTPNFWDRSFDGSHVLKAGAFIAGAYALTHRKGIVATLQNVIANDAAIILVAGAGLTVGMLTLAKVTLRRGEAQAREMVYYKNLLSQSQRVKQATACARADRVVASLHYALKARAEAPTI